MHDCEHCYFTDRSLPKIQAVDLTLIYLFLYISVFKELWIKGYTAIAERPFAIKMITLKKYVMVMK